MASNNRLSQGTTNRQQANKLTTDFVFVFDAFWRFVERAERDIREIGHLGRIPPPCFGDPWDDAFAESYDQIYVHLRKFRRVRFFTVPVGLAFFASPLKAETAHQALLFFLNPPAELYGEAGVLDSAEYKAIKKEALQELSARDTARIKRNGKQKSSSKQTAATGFQWAGAAQELLSFLMARHECHSATPKYEIAGTQQQIAGWLNRDKVSWDQKKVSVTMGQLFEDVARLNHLSPMLRYKTLCKSEEICRELVRLSLKPVQTALRREYGDDNIERFSSRGY